MHFREALSKPHVLLAQVLGTPSMTFLDTSTFRPAPAWGLPQTPHISTLSAVIDKVCIYYTGTNKAHLYQMPRRTPSSSAAGGHTK